MTSPGSPIPFGVVNNFRIANWIWTATRLTDPGEVRAFRRWFNSTRKISSAFILITADDVFDIYVNGNQVGTGFEWKKAQLLRVSLDHETNVFDIKVGNSVGDAGLLVGIRVTFSDGLSPSFIRSDDSWSVSMLDPRDSTFPPPENATWELPALLGQYGSQPWGNEVSWPDVVPTSAPSLPSVSFPGTSTASTNPPSSMSQGGSQIVTSISYVTIVTTLSSPATSTFISPVDIPPPGPRTDVGATVGGTIGGITFGLFIFILILLFLRGRRKIQNSGIWVWVREYLPGWLSKRDRHSAVQPFTEQVSQNANADGIGQVPATSSGVYSGMGFGVGAGTGGGRISQASMPPAYHDIPRRDEQQRSRC